MSAPKKGTRKFQIQLETVYIEELRKVAEVQGEPSANALAARLIREGLKGGGRSENETSSERPVIGPEIDLRSLLIEAYKANTEANKIIGESNRTIAELSRTITALSEERKNAPAEPAAIVAPSASTAPSATRRQNPGRVRVIAGPRQGSPV